MHHLAGGMNPGIGASGTDHPDRVCRNPGQGRFELALHGAHGMPLQLPPGKAAAIVLDAERDSHPASRPAGAARAPGSAEFGNELPGLVALGLVTFVGHFLQDADGALAVAHLDIGAC